MDLSVAVVVQISLGLMCVTCYIFPDALKTSIFTPKGQTMTLHKTIFFLLSFYCPIHYSEKICGPDNVQHVWFMNTESLRNIIGVVCTSEFGLKSNYIS